MSEQTPYQTLGVTENASFEEIQAVKNHLSQQYQGDTKTLELVETAYDAIIMDRLRMRQEGKIKVPEKIRFPERSAASAGGNQTLVMPPASPWLKQLVDTPSRNDILLPLGVFGILASISFFGQDSTGSFRSLILVMGVFANLYFLNRKERKFGRAFLLTLGGLVLGVALGAGLTYLLSTYGQLGVNGEQVATAMTLLLFWLLSSFIR
jgi:hypothetical protein